MANENSLVLVCEEHEYGSICKYFTTLGEYHNELMGVYGSDYIGLEFSSEIEDADAHEDGTTDLLSIMKDRDGIWFDLKYRSVCLSVIDEGHPIDPCYLKPGIGNLAYTTDPSEIIEDESIEEEMYSCTAEDLRRRGLSEEEVEQALRYREEEDLDKFFPYFSEWWCPEYTPEEIHDRLRAIEVPERVYIPRG